MSFTFDAVAHRYHHDGRVIPGVTATIGILADYDGIPRAVLDRKADIGRAVHEHCDLIDTDELALDMVHADLAGYCRSYLAFRADMQPKVLLAEQPILHPVHMYAGTPDRYIEMRKLGRMVIDIKTTVAEHPLLHGTQLAAYRELIASHLNDRSPAGGAALYLRKDGTYAFRDYTADLAIFWRGFQSLLFIDQLRKRYGNH